MGETGKFYSWEIIDEITAIKNCDKSFFEYRGSGVPKEIRWFFDSEDIQNGEQIPLILIYKDNEYKAHIEMESANHSRTRMFWKNDLKKEFDEVLKDAQAKGYAEKDPTADIEGYDACRKIAILTSLVCGQQVDFEDIHTEGITHISATDIKYAKAMGRAIKLLATSKKTDGGYVAMVAPFLLPKEHPLYNVNGVFNAIFVRGNVLGDPMFYGSGAGKLPTASAVVADVVEMAKNLDKNIPVEWSSKKLELVDYRSAENRFFVRVSGTDKASVEKVFGNVEYIDAQGVTGELGFVTEVMTEEALENKKAAYGEVLNVIRVA